MYLRFVLPRTNPDSGIRDGVFETAYEIERDGELSVHERRELAALLAWFSRNLTIPTRFNRTKSKGYYHRVTKGEQPACVESCPVGARLFGRIDDPTSEISQRIAAVPTHVLKEYLGTHPKTRYVGISREVT